MILSSRVFIQRLIQFAVLICIIAEISEIHAAEIEPCNSLSGQSLWLDAQTPVSLAAAKIVPATAVLPSYCAVTGFIAPQVGFELRLPSELWNGRYLQQGCRGLCGYIPIDTTNDGLARGYAVATTDMGHKGASSQSALWAINNPQAKADFGHRATHVVALTALELIERYYGKKPKAKYFRGCGTGGRQGLVEAQRYPDDFDGIIANGGVVFNFTKLNYLMAWSVRANINSIGKQILLTKDLAILHEAVLEKCDLNDGVRDRVIGNPLQCKFKPETLACEHNISEGCFTLEKINVAKKMYEGPKRSQGEVIYPGMAFGSELRWASAFFGTNPNYGKFSTEILRNFLPTIAKDASFQLSAFDIDEPLENYSVVEGFVGADTTDFSKYIDHGGKLLILHGWNESAMPGAYPVQFYEKLVKSLGSEKAVNDFFKLYMISGDMHCTSGIPEGRHFDALSLMEQWVEEGFPPDIIDGYELKNELKLPDQVRFPLEPFNIKTKRQFVPHPGELIYQGSGDPAEVQKYKRLRH